MSISGTEIVVSVLGLGAGFLLYQMGKTKINETQILDGVNRTKTDGINPNWNPGAKIEPPATIDYGGADIPSCQVWDDNAQLFVPAGGQEAKSSAEKCFSSFPGKLLRYVGGDLVPQFNTKKPLEERDKNKGGVCYKYNGNWTGQPGPGPINASQRLCFASGDTLQTEGALFANLNDPNQYYFVSPNYSYGDKEIPWNSMPVYNMPNVPIPAGGWYGGKQWVPPPKGGHCEEKAVKEKYIFWAHTVESSSNDANIESCVNARNGGNTRWRDGEEIVYWDSYINDMVKTKRPALK